MFNRKKIREHIIQDEKKQACNLEDFYNNFINEPLN
jgi:hypothetical protein